MAPDYSTPGQDLFEALVRAIDGSTSGEACELALRALGDGGTWAALSAHARAIFSEAALVFLSE